MASLTSKFKKLFWSQDRKRREFSVQAANFALENRHALIIIADPDSDVIVISQNGNVVAHRFRNESGKRMHIVSNAIHYLNKKTDKSIDQFLLAVDSGLYNLAKKRYDMRKRKPLGRALSLVGIGKRPDLERDGSVKSPFQFESAADGDVETPEKKEVEEGE